MKPKVRARAISRRKVFGSMSSASCLLADQRMVEFDFGLDPEAVAVGPQFAEGAVLGDTRTGLITSI